MFLGYQLRKVGEEIKTVEGEDGTLVETVIDITEPFISYIAETREELENMPCVSFESIEETDKEYFLHNGEYVCEVPFDQQVEEMRQARANAYASEVDPLMSEYNRKKTFNLFEGNEEAELLAKIEAKVEEIKTRYPYPADAEPTKGSDNTVVELAEGSEDLVELYSMEI